MRKATLTVFEYDEMLELLARKFYQIAFGCEFSANKKFIESHSNHPQEIAAIAMAIFALDQLVN